MQPESITSKNSTKTAVDNKVLYIILALLFMAGYVLGSSLGHNSAIEATNLRMYTLEQRMNENRSDIKRDYDAKITDMIEQSKITAKELRLLQEDYINLTATVQANHKIEVKH